MGRHRLIEKKEPPQATELSQLKEELRRVSEKLKTCDGVFAEALAQQNATREILRASSRTFGKKTHSVALTFLFPVTALLFALSAEAQPPTKVSRIGYLNAGASYRSAALRPYARV